MLIAHKDHNNTMQDYSGTVMTVMMFWHDLHHIYKDRYNTESFSKRMHEVDEMKPTYLIQHRAIILLLLFLIWFV